MPPQFTFQGRVLSVIDSNRICVRLDSDHIDSISVILSTANDKTVVKDTIIVNTKDCRFSISNIEWNELSDLIGVHIKINATYRRYNYWRTKEVCDQDNNNHRITVKYKGITILAKKVSNIV